MPEVYRQVYFCRLCTSTQLAPVLDLGEQYVVDFLDADSGGMKAPLKVVRCQSCSLAQLAHTVHRDVMYRKYWYRSGTSETMRAALKDVAQAATGCVALRPGDIVLDIGANDGTLLREFPKETYKLGIDPAKNNVIIGTNEAIYDYFSYRLLTGRKAKVVTSVAMFYDVDRPLDFAADVADVLEEDGVWINQLNYLPEVLKNNAVDFFSHEHITHWGLRVMCEMLKKVGLEVFKAEVLPLNGGTIRAYIQHSGIRPVERRVDDLWYQEAGLTTDREWASFERKVKHNGVKLGKLLSDLRADGKRVFVRGASTRGNSLLQYYGLGVNELPYAADRDEHKWGKKMVGTDIPILSEAEAKAMNPDYFLVLPYSYLNQFVDRDRDYLAAGGGYIVPLPYARVISGEEALRGKG